MKIVAGQQQLLPPMAMLRLATVRMSECNANVSTLLVQCSRIQDRLDAYGQDVVQQQ